MCVCDVIFHWIGGTKKSPISSWSFYETIQSLDWICWENLNRKPFFFNHRLWGFPAKIVPPIQ